jgi:tetratricopeptide (TPR) repeat protein
MPDTPPVPLFRRFLVEDRATTLQEIAADRARLADAQRAGDTAAELAIRTGIGFGLYITANEAEAAPMLDAALSLARALADRSAEIEVLLHLATARQYLGQRDLAQSLFEQALALSSAHDIHMFDHFILYHQGRCWVEQGQIGAARRCFERALPLREQLGIPRFINSTRAALADLAHW